LNPACLGKASATAASTTACCSAILNVCSAGVGGDIIAKARPKREAMVDRGEDRLRA
jgi:hypothetical protein